VSYALSDDIRSTLSADLEGTWLAFGEEGADVELPKITGTVDVLSFTYKRPVSMSADLSTLARRGKRTEFESYDPSLDRAELDILITSEAPFRLENNLLNASLILEKPGLQLTGTNQRFGLRGRMDVAKGGRIQLRRNEFEIQTGEVRFSDNTTITPRVDVTAVTEYRRYGATDGAVNAAAPVSGSSSNGAGQWRISMHAHGDADDLKIDLSSEPALSQDDVFLLLTVGLTRAELDRAQSAGLGQSVALEALGSLTGADTAVTDAIPLIDDFGFGSEYSSQTGRTEPTVTISKRLSERIRAYVTSRIGARDVRSNVEWTLSPQISVQGSYDNINNFSTPNLGNLGADVRWRLEFE
jgi:translocation and assembly module TamB